MDLGSEGDDSKERARIGSLVGEIEERMGRLNKISRERNEILKDLKERVRRGMVNKLVNRDLQRNLWPGFHQVVGSMMPGIPVG